MRARAKPLALSQLHEHGMGVGYGWSRSAWDGRGHGREAPGEREGEALALGCMAGARRWAWWRLGRGELGRGGEALAERFLERQGYQTVERNVRLGRGQIDLVMRENGVLCFVEVKTRRSAAAGDPLEAVDRRKQRQLADLALRYLQNRRLGEPPCRFDVVAVRSGEDGLPVCELVRGAFEDA